MLRATGSREQLEDKKNNDFGFKINYCKVSHNRLLMNMPFGWRKKTAGKDPFKTGTSDGETHMERSIH